MVCIPKSEFEEPLERRVYYIEQFNAIIQKHLKVDVAVDNAAQETQ